MIMFKKNSSNVKTRTASQDDVIKRATVSRWTADGILFGLTWEHTRVQRVEFGSVLIQEINAGRFKLIKWLNFSSEVTETLMLLLFDYFVSQFLLLPKISD